MRQQIKPTVERLVIRPLRDLVDTTFELIIRPASVAREFAEEDGHQFARAVTYFVAAFSAAVILENIAHWSLGLETFSEVPYWTINLLIFLSITALTVLIALVFGSSPLALFVKSACLAYGACILIGSFLVAGASITLAALHELGYIPGLTPDLTSFENYQRIWKQSFFDCMRKESALYDFAYQGFDASYQKLNYPLDHITKISSVLFIAAAVLFAVLAFYGTKRRHWAAAVAAVLSPVIVLLGTYFGLKAWINHVEANPSCNEHSIEVADQTATKEHVRGIAEIVGKRVGSKARNGNILTSVEPDDKALIMRVQVPKLDEGANGFHKRIDIGRRLAARSYCSSDEYQTSWRKRGVSWVTIYRYADTDLVETVVLNPDICAR